MDSDQDDQYIVIIVECCENCDTHQNITRHSEWKYYEQFNQFKRKIERFVPNTIVVKNPIPDQLHKSPDATLNKNQYVNRETEQIVLFPRIGTFEVYIFNVLVYSKLLSNSWPNHYKLIQTLNKIIQENKKGNSLEQFSVYRGDIPVPVEDKPKPHTSKKKKKDYRVYKSKDKSNILSHNYESPTKKPNNNNIDTINLSTKKANRRTLLVKERDLDDYPQGRGLETKAQKRVKLPSLRNTINFKDDEEIIEEQQQSIIKSKKGDDKGLKRIFNSIDQFDKQQISFIQRKSMRQQNNFNSLVLEEGNQSIEIMKSLKGQDSMKFLENRSVQYSERQFGKDFMNRSIQYEEQQGKFLDFGLQFDDGTAPKEINTHFVQTDKIWIITDPQQEPQKPYMLDQQIQANIIIPKNQKDGQTQTVVKQYTQAQINTDPKSLVNRGYQFPEQQIPKVDKTQFNKIDDSFQHLFEKRRNIHDQVCFYSVDKFVEKETKYKWIGRAGLINPNQKQVNPQANTIIKQNVDDLRRAFTLQLLVFAFYNYFGIKTADKRLSLQSCSNVISNPDEVGSKINSKKSDTALVHVLTLDNPELQYPEIFQQCEYSQSKYPLAEELTFRSSKQRIKFTNYGGLLALAYFLGDKQLFNEKRSFLGLVVSNDEVKEIYKLSADNYSIEYSYNPKKHRVIVDETLGQNQEKKTGIIALDRMSEEVQMEFITMLSKIFSEKHFNQMLRSIEDNFIQQLPSHKTFKPAIISTRLQKLDQELVKQFIDMLKTRKENIQDLYRGQIYAFHHYRSIQPKICFSLECFSKKEESIHLDTNLNQTQNPQHITLERTFTFNTKLVKGGQIQKHVRNKDNFVIIEGESGIGKSTFLQNLTKDLKNSYGDKLRIRKIGIEVLTDPIIMEKRANEILDQYRKQVIVIDGAESYFSQTIEFLQHIYNSEDQRRRPQMSYVLAISTNGRHSEAMRFRGRVLQYGLEVVICQLMPLDVDEIRNYMMKCIQFHSFTGKKNLLIELLGQENIAFNQSHPKYKIIKVLQNPFYLRLYTQYLAHLPNLEDYKACLLYSFNRYSMLKEAFSISYRRHLKETVEMVQEFKENTTFVLKKIAFQYFHNNYEINQAIRDFSNKIATQDQIISNQLSFYPINVEALVNRNLPLFQHKQYLNFFLIEAYCFYIEKSYRNLHMNKLYANVDLMNLITEHYAVEHTHSKLIQIIEKSRKYKNTQQQASCAISLLTKMGFMFSNYNFDEVEIPDADLSMAVFYSSSFRGANLNNAQMYRTQMMNCQIDGAKMDNINMLVKKYEIQYTVLAASMSSDGRNLALGCGNYLIIVQTQTGKELKKIQAHMDIIRTVKYSKDSINLVTIADDKTLRIWDTRTYRSVVFRLPQKGTIAFSNQTQTIASVSKNNLKVWNIKSMANQYVLEGHSDLITCINFSVDGKYIVTGSRDTTVKLWSIAKGQLLKNMKGHNGQLISVKISPSRRLIVSSSKEKDLMVWGFQKGNQISRAKLSDEIVEICLDEKEKYAAIAFAKEHKIIVLDIETLKTIHTLKGHKGRIISINFDFSFKKLISLGKDKTVRVWDFEKIIAFQSKQYEQRTMSKLKSSKKPILTMAFCKISLKYATGHQNGQINIYSAADNRIIDQLISHNGAVRCLQYDKAGKLYAAGSDGVVRIWNLQARRQPRTLELHSSEIVAMKLNEKNKVICTASTANQLVVADFTGINILMSTREEGRVHAIDFSKDQKSLAVGGTEKYIAIYEITESGGSISRKEQFGPNSDIITCLKFQGDLYLVAALKNGHIGIWNHIRGTLMKKIQNISPITSVLNFQKKYVCFTSEDGKVRIVDMNEGKQVKIFRYFEQATSIVTNTGENLLYMSTNSGNVLVWNLDSIRQKNQKVQFDRQTFDEEGNKVVHIEGPRELLIRDLHFHQQEYCSVKDVPSPVEGVTFFKGQIIMLLKNGMHWEFSKNREFVFGAEQQVEGELQWVKTKGQANFFKTAVKRIKGIKRPIQTVLEELSTV